MSEVAKALQGAIDLLTRIYESPSLAHARVIPMVDAELQVLRAAVDTVHSSEIVTKNWRESALSAGKQAAASSATARIAIGHLQAVLNKARTFDEQQRADTAARDWLTSIGSEPT